MFTIHNDQLSSVVSLCKQHFCTTRDMVLRCGLKSVLNHVIKKISTVLVIPLEGVSWNFKICNYVNTMRDCFKSPLSSSNNKLFGNLIRTVLRREQGIKPFFAIVIVALL